MMTSSEEGKVRRWEAVSLESRRNSRESDAGSANSIFARMKKLILPEAVTDTSSLWEMSPMQRCQAWTGIRLRERRQYAAGLMSERTSSMKTSGANAKQETPRTWRDVVIQLHERRPKKTNAQENANHLELSPTITVVGVILPFCLLVRDTR